MSNILDLPQSFIDDEEEVLVIDNYANVYSPSTRHDGMVVAQKCLVRKGKYKDTPTTIKGLNDPSHPKLPGISYLVKETNFQDVGGGLMTFEKQFATLPTIWFEYEEVSYRADYNGRINYRNRAGIGASWHRTRNVVAKATHYYLPKPFVPKLIVPDSDNAGRLYAFNFSYYYNTPPQSKLSKGWEDYDTPQGLTLAIAPDRIQRYMGDIYEFIRYTIEL